MKISALLLALPLTACVTGTATTRTTIPTSLLVPATQEAPPHAGDPLTIAATPVQLDVFDAVGDIDGKRFPLYLRVPQGIPTTQATVPPTDEPTLVGTDNYPKFNGRTVPLAPFGSFFVALMNTSAQPITVHPAQITLRIAGKTLKPMSDGGAISGHWKNMVKALKDGNVGMPRVGPPISDLQASLPFLDHDVTIAPSTGWKDYVAFDTGAFTADEYNALLGKAHTLWLALSDGQKELASLKFDAQSSSLAAVCLPGTSSPSFTRCEVLVSTK